MPTPTTAPARQAGFINVVRVISDNFLEMYDFRVFGYYASAIAATFFPTGTPFVSLRLTMMTFGAGFLMGALVLGTYIDRRGRRAGLVLTLGLMACGTLTIACVPGYATLGLLVPAPARVLAGRLLPALNWGACRAIWRKSRPPAEKGCTSVSSPPVSSSRSFLPPC